MTLTLRTLDILGKSCGKYYTKNDLCIDCSPNQHLFRTVLYVLPYWFIDRYMLLLTSISEKKYRLTY